MNAKGKLVVTVGLVMLVLAGVYTAYEWKLSPNAVQMDFVRSKLNDPDSATFRRTFASKRGEGIWCGEVNARNRMGGLVGFTRYVAMVKDSGDFSYPLNELHFDDSRDGNVRDLSSGDSSFAGKWSVYCE